MGDRYLRRLLVVGMTSLIRRAKATPTSVDPRLPALLQRKPVRVVTVAAANRTARVAWAIMTRGGTYRAPWPRPPDSTARRRFQVARTMRVDGEPVRPGAGHPPDVQGVTARKAEWDPARGYHQGQRST